MGCSNQKMQAAPLEPTVDSKVSPQGGLPSAARAQAARDAARAASVSPLRVLVSEARGLRVKGGSVYVALEVDGRKNSRVASPSKVAAPEVDFGFLTGAPHYVEGDAVTLTVFERVKGSAVDDIVGTVTLTREQLAGAGEFQLKCCDATARAFLRVGVPGSGRPVPAREQHGSVRIEGEESSTSCVC